MIARDGICPDCRHPWAWHPAVPLGSPFAGCVGRVADSILLSAGTSHRCDCQSIYPGHVRAVAAIEPDPELVLRARWGDR